VPLPDELERRGLLDRLNARWQHPVTVVVAGAGFGKSTLLAQAVRANALEPRGIDLWYSCTPGDVDVDRLGADLLAAVGADGRRPDLVSHLADALAGYLADRRLPRARRQSGDDGQRRGSELATTTPVGGPPDSGQSLQLGLRLRG
jgi:hypothetical protein